MTNDRTCQWCGGPLPGRARKWCSERCRKHLYDRPCIDCGARVSGTDPGRTKGRCQRCSRHTLENPKTRAEFERRIRAEAMWSDGFTARQIAEALEIHYYYSMISIWRRRGYDLPHRRTPEQLARMLAGSDERMAKARAVFKATR